MLAKMWQKKSIPSLLMGLPLIPTVEERDRQISDFFPGEGFVLVSAACDVYSNMCYPVFMC